MFTEALSVYQLAPDMMASDVLLVAYAKEIEADSAAAEGMTCTSDVTGVTKKRLTLW